MSQGTRMFSPSSKLVTKLSGLVSLKGGDLMLQRATDVLVKFQRLRAGVPSNLWRWETVAGWQWGGDPEHINVLEAKPFLATVKWRVYQRKQTNVRCVHLVDSLVAPRVLTRGRSSSRKMRRTMMRISAYLLASGLQPIWAYVDTKEYKRQPSRRTVSLGNKKRWLKK